MEAKNINNSVEIQYSTNDDDETRVLPDSIVMDEILTKLPVKSLIRFQAVSKQWLSTISKDPHFAKRYLKISSLFRPHFFIRVLSLFLCKKTDDFFLLPYQEFSSEKDLVEVGYGGREICFDVVDSCNGLVCLYHIRYVWETAERKFYFEFWNPATHKRNVIDSPPGVYVGLAYGFGYIPSLDDYKIICSFGTEREGDAVFRGLYVFSLRSGKWEKKFSGYDYSQSYRKWRRIRNYSDEDKEKEKIVIKLKDRGSWNRGILYWPPQKESSRNYIIGFDLMSEEFKEYTSIDGQCGYDEVELFRLKGCLALHGRCKSDKVSEFWTLKDSDDWSSWQLLFSVDFINIPFATISETGRCLVQQSTNFKLIDLSKEALKSVQGVERYLRPEVKAFDHVESLVLPFGMPKSNEEEEHLK